MLGPTLARMEHLGYLMMAIPGPTKTALQGHAVIGLYFSVDWCQPCLAFTPVLKKLYGAQRAWGADQLEVVLVSRCQEAKATKYYREDMPWVSIWHDADDSVGMEACTSSLMARFGITSIPALVLLDKRGGLICAYAWDKCVADPEGQAFLWWQQSRFPQAAEMSRRVDTTRLAKVARKGKPTPVAQTLAPARTARQGPVVNFDLLPQNRLQPEPTCARPQAFVGGAAAGGPRGMSTQGAALGLPVGFPVGKRFGETITTGTQANAPQAHGDNEGRA
jgi:hypothetical protein